MDIGSEVNECNCECHRNPNVKHFVACCVQCPYCGVQVKSYIEHVKTCKRRKINGHSLGEDA